MATVPEAVPQDPVRRYSNVAVTFHWVTVGDDVSVALTFAITTEATRRSVDEHRRSARAGSFTRQG